MVTSTLLTVFSIAVATSLVSAAPLQIRNSDQPAMSGLPKALGSLGGIIDAIIIDPLTGTQNSQGETGHEATDDHGQTAGTAGRVPTGAVKTLVNDLVSPKMEQSGTPQSPDVNSGNQVGGVRHPDDPRKGKK